MFVACVIGLALASTALAGGNEVTLTGFVLNKACAGEHSNALAKFAESHKRSCNLAPKCRKSGLGLVTEDGKWYAFDADGSEQAAKLLESSSEQTGPRVEVKGTLAKGVLKVSEIRAAGEDEEE
jgi:hypothetical protein